MIETLEGERKMKTVYTSPEIQVVFFGNDVIVTSVDDGNV